MPCQLTPEEIAYEERRENQNSFGRPISDRQLLEEVACQACRHIASTADITGAPTLVQKWWRAHQLADEQRQKQEEKDKQAKEKQELETLEKLKKKYPSKKRK